jgi:divalent metal cation (Fe/Co/Zn/Cd) transporter
MQRTGSTVQAGYSKLRRFASWSSIVVAVALVAMKLAAWIATG